MVFSMSKLPDFRSSLIANIPGGSVVFSTLRRSTLFLCFAGGSLTSTLVVAETFTVESDVVRERMEAAGLLTKDGEVIGGEKAGKNVDSDEPGERQHIELQLAPESTGEILMPARREDVPSPAAPLPPANFTEEETDNLRERQNQLQAEVGRLNREMIAARQQAGIADEGSEEHRQSMRQLERLRAEATDKVRERLKIQHTLDRQVATQQIQGN